MYGHYRSAKEERKYTYQACYESETTTYLEFSGGKIKFPLSSVDWWKQWIRKMPFTKNLDMLTVCSTDKLKSEDQA